MRDRNRDLPARAGARWVVLGVVAGLAAAPAAADEGQARALFRAMSDYLAAQTAIAFDYDSTLDIVTTEGERIGLASSGSVALARPDRLHATRTGGFVDAEMNFDGTTLTLYGRHAGAFTEIEAPGSVDALIDTLRESWGMPLPAADLLGSDVDGHLMANVTEAKDLGSGVIRGVECDHLAFRADEVDWQIWIAQGDAPYPCRLTVTTPSVTGWPQYSIDVRDWKTGADAAHDFTITVAAGATRVEPGALEGLDEVGGIYQRAGE
jgi:hypothetical protein